ncbi:MAG: phosphoribosylanthranilate isomerase [Culicoidibacterales bacterium]
MVKIKICGLKTEQDIVYANKVKPNYIGFVFAPSKRQVTIDQAILLKAHLNPQILAVGVFVNQPISFIGQAIKAKTIDIVQLHGDEDDKYMSELQEQYSITVIQANRVAQISDIKKTTAEYQLFDTKVEDAYGGSGQIFDWSILANCQGPFFVAGGLCYTNIRQAIEVTRPYAVDVSSGVEVDGQKDLQLMKQFVEIIRRKN